MKPTIFFLLFLVSSVTLAQKKGKILVVSNAPGQVLLDGATIGEIAAGRPMIQEATIGDHLVGSSRVDLQACKLEYSIVSPK